MEEARAGMAASRGGAGRGAGAWRALGLAACTLWSNVMLLRPPLYVTMSDVSLLARVVSMLSSVVGFALVALVGARGGRVGGRRAPTVACSVACAAFTLLYFFAPAQMPTWALWVAVVAYSVTLAPLLVGCGETYARMDPQLALAAAAASYFLGWTASAALGALSDAVAGVTAACMPLLALATMPCWGARGAGARPAATAGAGGRPAPRELMASLLLAIPGRTLLALAIAFFALGTMMVDAGMGASGFGAGGVAAALVTSVLWLALGMLARDRLPLVTLYKAALVLQVLGIFMLGQWADAAQLVSVVSLVGVNIVSWTLLSQYAHAGGVLGVSAALVFAAGHVCEHLGEGLGVLTAVCGALGDAGLMVLTVALLLVAAVFLFSVPSEDDRPARGARAGDPAATPRDPAALGADAPSGAAGCQPGAAPSDAPAAEAAPGAAGDTVAGDPSRRAQSVLTSPALARRLEELADRYRLSARERDVFELWATGHDVKYVQEKLGLSASTVKTHIRHIYAKTDLHSRAEVMALLDEGDGAWSWL